MPQIDAPAKINLFLDILARRGDGYHDLHTAFLSIDLCDELVIEEAAGGETHLEVAGPHGEGVPTGEENLVLHSIRALEKRVGESLPPLSLFLKKNIPHGAGLGGGSSDAAAALLLLNAWQGHPLGHQELRELAARIGSDCAFFIEGGAAEAHGRGELLDPLSSLRHVPLLVVRPPFAMSTREAYMALDTDMLGPQSDAAGLRRWLAGEIDEMPELYNTFELALEPAYPELRRIREALHKEGALLSRLSGSGSAVFGLFESEEGRDRAADALKDFGDVFLCASYRRGERSE